MYVLQGQKEWLILVMFNIEIRKTQSQNRCRNLLTCCPTSVFGLIKPTSTGPMKEKQWQDFAHVMSRIKLSGISFEKTVALKGLLHLFS